MGPNGSEIVTISAERIRAGEIDRTGTVYAQIFNQTLMLTPQMRAFFAKLHGEIITEPTKSELIPYTVVIGDSALETFITNKWKYDLGVFDYKKKRKESKSSILESLKFTVKAPNNPGTINATAVKKLAEWNQNQPFKHLFIEGEEDLMAVAAVLLLPLESKVYYGQPNVGLVETTVTEDLKESFYSVLARL